MVPTPENFAPTGMPLLLAKLQQSQKIRKYEQKLFMQMIFNSCSNRSRIACETSVVPYRQTSPSSQSCRRYCSSSRMTVPVGFVLANVSPPIPSAEADPTAPPPEFVGFASANVSPPLPSAEADPTAPPPEF